MSLLLRLVYDWKCRGTHHKLAVDALRQLRGDSADRWRDLFLTQFAAYLEGAKAPDTEFKDFRNHVLHVADGGWGGAVATAEQWYQQTVDALRARRWKQAVYSAGVLSHYVTDPLMPLHTGQSDAENTMHRACEWSVSRSYADLLTILTDRLGGVPAIELPSQEQWLKRLLTRNATTAHAEYDRVVSGYDFASGVKKPAAGLNQELREIFARLLGLAIASFARVLERALQESGAKAPWTVPSFTVVLASIQAPMDWVTRALSNVEERKLIKAMYRELQSTGRVEQTLPDENRIIRELHAREVLGAPVAPQPTSAAIASPVTPQRSGARLDSSPAPADILPVAPARAARKAKSSGAMPRFYLELDDPVVDAPSIGPKTARKLQQVGISCVEMFLEHTPADIVSLLDCNTITLEEIRTWQQQARLMCQIPGLRGHDVQMLIACGISTPEQLAEANASTLHQQVCRFAVSPTAKRQMRSPQPPEKQEVRNWVAWAAHSRPLRAA